MIIRKFTLSIELVPSTVWYANLYNFYKNNDQMEIWHELKQYLFEREGHHCWICKKEVRNLEAHEFWEYDDYTHVQKLIAIHHLCDLCHKIKHIGLWCYTPDGQAKLKRQQLTREDLVKHFCTVNNCTFEEFQNHEDSAFKEYSGRSKFRWKQDLGVYNPKHRLKILKSQKKLTWIKMDDNNAL